MPSSLEAFLIILFLLPGFVGLIVYDSVAAGPKRETVDKVVTALVITLLANAIVPASGLMSLLGGVPKPPSPPGFFTSLLIALGLAAPPPAPVDILGMTMRGGLLPVTLVAAAIGLAFAWLQNKGWIYRVLSRLGITRRTGAVDVWSQVFSRSGPIWVRVLFKDGSMLVGWPRFYSEDGETKELFLSRAAWHYPRGRTAPPGQASSYREVEVQGPGVLITNFDAVHSLEIIRPE